MLIFNDRNIEYLETMRVCDVIEKSNVQDLFYPKNVIDTLKELLSVLWKPDYWNIMPLYDKRVSLSTNIGDGDFCHTIIINSDGSMKFDHQ